VNKLTGWNGS